MKQLFLLGLAFVVSTAALSQDLPPNPEPGKCYVRCTTPDVYVNETVQVMTMPAYKTLKTVPATFETVTDRVMTKAEGKKISGCPRSLGIRDH
jgi:hypothetical protein